MTVLLVVAKAPVPGQVKTRLCPPATPRQAAVIAAAALLDTLAAVRAAPSVTPVLAYAGRLADAEGADQIRAALAGWRLIPQRGAGFAERLANAHEDVAAGFPGRPVLQIGMDTPQVDPALLAAAARRLASAGAVLGPAADGGWWSLGLRDPRLADALRGVPMSTSETGNHTRAALRGRGLNPVELPILSDVDTWECATSVAAAAEPGSRFAAAVAAVTAALGDGFDAVPAGDGFDAALAQGEAHWLIDTAGERAELPVHRWHGPAEPAARELIDRCVGPTLDIGCGPGRLTTELAHRGVVSFGIDTSATAVRLTRGRGGRALRLSVYDRLPAEGRWSHVLLADGNIGIGGDPVALLRRCADLLRPGGTILVELDPGADVWRGRARVVPDGLRTGPAAGGDAHTGYGPSFPWARLGAGAIDRLAVSVGLTVRAAFCRDGRWFAELERP